MKSGFDINRHMTIVHAAEFQGKRVNGEITLMYLSRDVDKALLDGKIEVVKTDNGHRIILGAYWIYFEVYKR